MMAWIKMRVELRGDLAVIRLGKILGLERDLIVGLLHRFWSWADGQSVDGRIPFLGLDDVDEEVGHKGFAAGLKEVGWLVETKGGLQLPHYDRHNGESAKRRAADVERKRQDRASSSSPSWKRRAVSADCPGDFGPKASRKRPRNLGRARPQDVRESSDQRREENRRGEKSREEEIAINTVPPDGGTGGRRPPFSKFWLLIPNKEKKKRAEERWARMSPADCAKALDTYPRHAAIYTRYEMPKHLIPLPASWLGDGRWDDDVEALEARVKSRMGKRRGVGRTDADRKKILEGLE